MYRFNKIIVTVQVRDSADLNTTHVSVQFYKCFLVIKKSAIFKYNPCIGSMSCRISLTAKEPRFKYNPCIGSMLELLGLGKCFF